MRAWPIRWPVLFLMFAQLRPPFPYRTLVPAIAAALPGDLRQAFAGLNWLFMSASACLMTAVALRAGLDGAWLLAVQAPAPLKPLRSLLFLMALPPLYAALCVRVEGRVVWGRYPFLIPFAASYLRTPQAPAR